MNLDYITINGLSQDVKTMLESDIGRNGYKGSVSGYVTQLMREALLQRGRVDEVKYAKSEETLSERLSAVEGRLDGIERAVLRKESGDEVYRQLLCRMYALLVGMGFADGLNMRACEEGEMDKLPWNLLSRYREAMEQYGNP